MLDAMTKTILDAGDDKQPRCRATGQLMLALIMTFGFFCTIGTLIFHEIPEKNHDIIISLVACMATLMTGTWAFYFASSIGSRNKEAMLDKLSTGPTVTETTTQGVGDNQTTKTTTTQPSGGIAPVAVNVAAPTPDSAPVTVTVQAPPAEKPKD